MKKILTYEEALLITENNDGFYLIETEVDGFPVSIFNYRLAQFSDFANPVEGENLRGDELRGLTYVFNKDKSLYKRYLMLTKFFNLNQVEETFYDVVKNKEIKSVMNKEDGSMISFLKLPNGKIVGRSKASFTSDQAIAANEIYETNSNIKKLVNWSIENDIALFFEYVSFKNRIVLIYKETDLILLRARNNKTGEYIDVRDINTFGVKIAEFEYHTLDSMIQLAEKVKLKEGWVIEFTDNTMLKIKTGWYNVHHKLLTESLNRENDIIHFILDETIDDVLAQLDKDEVERREYIASITKKITHYVSEKMDELQKMLNEWNGNRKAFALEFSKDPLFNIAMNVIFKEEDPYQELIKWVKKNTTHLKQAQKFLNNL